MEVNYVVTFPAHEKEVIVLRLLPTKDANTLKLDLTFDSGIFSLRMQESYDIHSCLYSVRFLRDRRFVERGSLAWVLWARQTCIYDVAELLQSDRRLVLPTVHTTEFGYVVVFFCFFLP